MRNKPVFIPQLVDVPYSFTSAAKKSSEVRYVFIPDNTVIYWACFLAV